MLQFKGINLSGLEVGNHTATRHGFDYKRPSSAHYDYWFDNQTVAVEDGGAEMNLVRLPFAWERVQTELYGDLDSGYLNLLKQQVEFAASKGASIILDMHNYGQYSTKNADGTIEKHYIGDPEVPVSAFQDVWKKLAVEFKDSENVIFELMNEPTASISSDQLSAIFQETVLNIREMGATNQILLSGNYWSTACMWEMSGNARAFQNFFDPLNNVAFDVHQYFDADSVGDSSDFINSPTTRLQQITDWARATGNKLFLGETAVDVSNPETAADNALKMQRVINFMDKNSDVWQGYSMWGGGEFWNDNYIFKLTPKFDSLGNIISEQDESLYLKSLSSKFVASEEPMWNETLGAKAYQKNFEAESLARVGGYTVEYNKDASGGAALISMRDAGGVNLDLKSNSGKYDVAIRYFDESDGSSPFYLKVNGRVVHQFVANEATNSVLRVASVLRTNIVKGLDLQKGDTVTVSSIRDRSDLGSLDKISLYSSDEKVTKDLDQVQIETSLNHITRSDIRTYIASQNDGDLKLVVHDDNEFSLTGNGWQALEIGHKITKDTIVSVDVNVAKVGEIQAIGFTNANEMENYNSNKFFQFAGTQRLGNNNIINNLKTGKDYNFTVNAGKFLSGNEDHMVIVSDDDAHTGGSVNYSGLKFYELTNTIYGTSADNNLVSTSASERMIGGVEQDNFFLTIDNLDKADLIQNFNRAEGDKVNVSLLADDLGVTVDNIISNLNLQVRSDGSGALLLNNDNAFHTLALFDNGMAGETLTSIISK